MMLAPEDSELDARLAVIGAQAGFQLSADQIFQLRTYLAALRRWNATINLTALPLEGFPAASLQRLIAEPLRGARLLRSASHLPGRWFDLGSGSGSPALPMKVVIPSLPLTMVESRGRKAAFLRDVVAQMGIRESTVFSGRIEELSSEEPGCAALVSARAVRLDLGISSVIRHLMSTAGEILLLGRSDWTALSAFATLVTAIEEDGTVLLSVPRGTRPGR